MTNQHPITPPPELVQQWVEAASFAKDGELAGVLATAAARWGADQELEACCHEVQDMYSGGSRLRAARRPKPPTLKQQALEALREAESTGCLYVNGRSDLIRRAIEALPND